LPDALPDGRPWPKVSIVTPSYNQEPYLEETIRSVLLQGYPNLEYIVVDGGSTDESLEIVRKYANWLAGWVSEPDRGQADAIMKGWRLATGGLFGYQNSDDTFLPGAIAEAALALHQSPDAGCVYGDVYFVDELSQVVGQWRAEDFDLREAVKAGAVFAAPAPGSLWRQSVMASLGGMDTSLDYCLDYDLWLRAGSITSLKRIPRFLATYRLHSASKTVAGAARFGDEAVRICEKLFEAPSVPEALAGIREQSLANANLYAAILNARARQHGQAVRHFRRAWQLWPRAFGPGHLLKWAWSSIRARLAGPQSAATYGRAG
jgi:GT2 family glycosyltransferase